MGSIVVDEACICKMGATAVFNGWYGREKIISSGGGIGFSGSLILSGLVEVAHGGGQRLGKVFADGVRRESGPGGKMAMLDGFDERGRYRTESGSVEKSDKIGFRGRVDDGIGRGTSRQVGAAGG